MKGSATEIADRFWRDGFVTVPDVVSVQQLRKLKAGLNEWIEQSRGHRHAFGSLQDGRPRFDVEPGHCRESPALRRVAAPDELNDDYLSVLKCPTLTQLVAQVIGPNLRLHHCKVNSKLPGSGTKVQWHQDFAFDPHSNDDMVTALIFLDDVTPENGPLKVVAGSHKGPLYTLWHSGVFTGAVADDVATLLEKKAITQTGPAGSVCLMHVRTAHSSGANTSERSRSLFIAAIAAADAVPLAENAVPSRHEGLMLLGVDEGIVRSTSFDLPMPELPAGASFFEQQAGTTSARIGKC